MKLSTKGRYGLRAMIELAKTECGNTLSIGSIAQRQQISEGYLEQIVSRLKKAGLVKSVRGAQGGYLLSKDAGRITAGDILRAVEGDLNPIDCPALKEEGACENSGSCASKFVWQRLNAGINDIVDSITLSELTRHENQACFLQQTEKADK